jgi:hypothetical protein
LKIHAAVHYAKNEKMVETSFSINLPVVKEISTNNTQSITEEERVVNKPIPMMNENFLLMPDAQSILFNMMVRQQQIYNIMTMNSFLFNHGTLGNLGTINNPFIK